MNTVILIVAGWMIGNILIAYVAGFKDDDKNSNQ